MTYTLLEEQFFPYPWCQRLLRGLNEEARKKRIEITQLTNLEEKPSEFGCVLLIGATSSWVNTMAEKARAVGLHPIVMTNRQPGASPFPFSSVMMDIQGSMQLAVQYLHALGKDRLALYGVNPLAASDPWRAECFALLTGKPDDVFVCGDSFEALYERFRAVIENYDSVICASDYAAISLVRRLQQDGYPIPEKLYLISYGNMALSQLMRPSITSISDGYEEFGRAALSISSLIEKNPAFRPSTSSCTASSTSGKRRRTVRCRYPPKTRQPSPCWKTAFLRTRKSPILRGWRRCSSSVTKLTWRSFSSF